MDWPRFANGYWSKDKMPGLLGKADVYVIYKNPNKKFTKPIIFLDGFDLAADFDPLAINNNFNGNKNRSGRHFEGLFCELTQPGVGNGRNVLDFLQDENCYDLVFVDWYGGADFIQKNALCLVEILNWINENKITNSPNVVVGPSMGGTIGRWALQFMEKYPNHPNVRPHQVSHFVSYDAPQNGANTPLGLQFSLAYAERATSVIKLIVDQATFGFGGIAAVDAAADKAYKQAMMVKTPAGLQGSVYHYLGTRVDYDVVGIKEAIYFQDHITDKHGRIQQLKPHPLFDVMQAEYAFMGGKPRQCKNIAIANGSANGIGQHKEVNGVEVPMLPSDLMLELRKQEGNCYFSYTASSKAFALPETGNMVVLSDSDIEGTVRIRLMTPEFYVVWNDLIPEIHVRFVEQCVTILAVGTGRQVIRMDGVGVGNTIDNAPAGFFEVLGSMHDPAEGLYVYTPYFGHELTASTLGFTPTWLATHGNYFVNLHQMSPADYMPHTWFDAISFPPLNGPTQGSNEHHTYIYRYQLDFLEQQLDDIVPSNVYVQNEVQSRRKLVMSTNTIAAGFNVISTRPIGNANVLTPPAATDITFVEYRAAESIRLAKGFKAQRGAKFLAKIDAVEACEASDMSGKRILPSHTNQRPTATPSTVYSSRPDKLAPTPKAMETSGLQVWPNPSSNGFQVRATYQEPDASEATLLVYDAVGKLVHQEVRGLDMQAESRQVYFEIPTHHFSQGIHFCVLRIGKEVFSQKLIFNP